MGTTKDERDLCEVMEWRQWRDKHVGGSNSDPAVSVALRVNPSPELSATSASPCLHAVQMIRLRNYAVSRSDQFAQISLDVVKRVVLCASVRQILTGGVYEGKMEEL